MKTESKTSPQSSGRGCLCEDETYHIDCCDGSLQAQGIGSLEGQGDVVLTQVEVERYIVRSNG